jgi:hypothetical protein
MARTECPTYFPRMVVYEVFGDSNIAKSWKAVASEMDQLKGSVLRQTTTLVSLRDHLKTVAQTTRFVIVSAITNPITRLKFEGAALLEQAVTERCGEVFDYLIQTLNNNPELKVSSTSRTSDHLVCSHLVDIGLTLSQHFDSQVFFTIVS